MRQNESRRKQRAGARRYGFDATRDGGWATTDDASYVDLMPEGTYDGNATAIAGNYAVGYHPQVSAIWQEPRCGCPLRVTALDKPPMSETIPTFTGSIPENYERYLVPIIFQPFADDLVSRIQIPPNGKLLELSCGTGVVSRALIAAAPNTTQLVLTDFSEAMLSHARYETPTPEVVTWELADACNLQYDDATFDVVCCQFGYMFYPDKPKAAEEILRVLKPSGRLVFNVWGQLSEIPIFDALENVLQETFPDEEKPIMPTPANMGDLQGVKTLIEQAGFKQVAASRVEFHIHGFPASQVANGFVYGTPLSKYFAELGRTPEEMRTIISQHIAEQFGDPIQTSMTAIVCEANA